MAERSSQTMNDIVTDNDRKRSAVIEDQEAGAAAIVKRSCVLNNNALALREALRHVPHLVTRESSPCLFPKASSSDQEDETIKADDDKLALYWTHRVQVFGERAFLPLSQTGKGALSQTEVDIMRRSEQWIVLPNDEEGRSVFFLNCSENICGSYEERLRCLFYLLSVAVENKASQEHGVVVLVRMPDEGDPSHVDDSVSETFEGFLRLLVDVLPIKLCSMVFVSISTKRSSETQDLLDTFCNNLGENIKSLASTYVASSKQDLVAALEARSFLRKSLPTALGGSHGYENTLMWHRCRAAQEKTDFGSFPMCLVPPHVVKDVIESIAAKKVKTSNRRKRTSSASTTTSCASRGPDEDDQENQEAEEERKRAIRERNALYARRKYARRKIEKEVLQEQCSSLEKKNHALKIEQRKLDTLLQEAKKIASFCDSIELAESVQEQRNVDPEPAPPPATSSAPQASNAVSLGSSTLGQLAALLASHQDSLPNTQGGVITRNPVPEPSRVHQQQDVGAIQVLQKIITNVSAEDLGQLILSSSQASMGSASSQQGTVPYTGNTLGSTNQAPANPVAPGFVPLQGQPSLANVPTGMAMASAPSTRQSNPAAASANFQNTANFSNVQAFVPPSLVPTQMTAINARQNVPAPQQVADQESSIQQALVQALLSGLAPMGQYGGG